MNAKARSARSEDQLDSALRSSLEPDPATAEALVRRALAADDTPSARTVAWRLAAAASVVALAVSTPLFLPRENTSELDTAPPNSYTAAESKPARLSISNESGLVTVTTPAGSKMVMLNPVSTGDIS